MDDVDVFELVEGKGVIEFENVVFLYIFDCLFIWDFLFWVELG